MINNLNFGIIGNCQSAALVSKKASIDWLCLPKFNEASVFAKILDQQKGGSFSIEVDEDYHIEQTYIEETCLLKTTFSKSTDAFEVIDFMPRYRKENLTYHSPPEVIRKINVLAGAPKAKIVFDPKLNYARGLTKLFNKPNFIVALTEDRNFDTTFLYSNLPHEAILKQSEISLPNTSYFVLSYNEKINVPNLDYVDLEMERTNVYWRNWIAKNPKYQNYQEYINRSALTLKLLSYDKSGAILAAATTSLPETIGEVRNWDYRFCWIRDASMVVKVISQLGHKRMAKRYLDFVVDLIPNKDEKLQIMYGIEKEKNLEEKFLEHLSGYQNSAPVRIGNAAFSQKQNDIYGILMDVIFQEIVKYGKEIDNLEQLWDITKGIAWVVGKHWQEPDKGIWEFRNENRHFTFSKVLCWVAIDRAIKVSEILGKTSKIARWKDLEKEIREDIHQNAWNGEVKAFTQSYHSTDLDASVLLMHSYNFIDAKDPKFIATVKAIGRELVNDGLLYRYKNKDDFGLPSSSFTICTFWYINSLQAIGEKEEAQLLFDKLLSYSNHLGLFSEDIDFKTKRLLGNFPQAYSHLALIETAINLNQ